MRPLGCNKRARERERTHWRVAREKELTDLYKSTSYFTKRVYSQVMRRPVVAIAAGLLMCNQRDKPSVCADWTYFQSDCIYIHILIIPYKLCRRRLIASSSLVCVNGYTESTIESNTFVVAFISNLGRLVSNGTAGYNRPFIYICMQSNSDDQMSLPVFNKTAYSTAVNEYSLYFTARCTE